MAMWMVSTLWSVAQGADLPENMGITGGGEQVTVVTVTDIRDSLFAHQHPQRWWLPGLLLCA